MAATRKPTPKRVAEETLELLHAQANPERAASYQRYFKEPVDYLGLDNKGAKKIKEDLFARVEESWGIGEAVRFCKAMLRDPHMEARGIGYQTVANFVSEAQPALLADVKRWLERSCGNWGLVDNLAPSVLGPLLDLHPELAPEVLAWTGSPSQWVRRGAVVAYVPLVGMGKKKHLTNAYRTVTRLLDDEEDLIHKACGWLLREAGKADVKRLEKYLLDKGSKIPRTTVRYAIERFSKADRKRLLEATR
jgi:3-methyladenine DNA glycosylase AlkD